jgi:hypothetical protein
MDEDTFSDDVMPASRSTTAMVCPIAPKVSILCDHGVSFITTMWASYTVNCGI